MVIYFLVATFPHILETKLAFHVTFSYLFYYLVMIAEAAYNKDKYTPLLKKKDFASAAIPLP